MGCVSSIWFCPSGREVLEQLCPGQGNLRKGLGRGVGQRCWSSFVQENTRLQVPGAVSRVLPSAPSIQLAAAEQMEQISAQLSFLRPLPQCRGRPANNRLNVGRVARRGMAWPGPLQGTLSALGLLPSSPGLLAPVLW